jgi:hypothetical protein
LKGNSGQEYCAARGYPKTLESDPDPNKYPSVNPLAQNGHSRSDNKQNSNETNWKTNHDSDNGQRAFPVKLIKFIQEVRQKVSPEPTPPEFVFELAEEAAVKNFIILKKYNFDLERFNQCTEIIPAGVWFQIQTTPQTEGDLPTSPSVGKNGVPTHQWI